MNDSFMSSDAVSGSFTASQTARRDGAGWVRARRRCLE